MPGLLVCVFYLLPYFLLDQVFFLLKGVFPDRPKVWYGSLSDNTDMHYGMKPVAVQLDHHHTN